MTIKNYICLTAPNQMRLTNQVKEFLAKGFQPFGGVSIACDQNYNYFSQAMVKYEEGGNKK